MHGLEGAVSVQWVDTKENLADLLSKGTFDAEQHDALKAGIMCRGVGKGGGAAARRRAALTQACECVCHSSLKSEE